MFRNVTARLLATLTCVSVVQPLRFHEIHHGSNPFAARLVLALRRLKPVLSPFSNSFNLRFFFQNLHVIAIPTTNLTAAVCIACQHRSSRFAARGSVLHGSLLGPQRASVFSAAVFSVRDAQRRSARQRLSPALAAARRPQDFSSSTSFAHRLSSCLARATAQRRRPSTSTTREVLYASSS